MVSGIPEALKILHSLRNRSCFVRLIVKVRLILKVTVHPNQGKEVSMTDKTSPYFNVIQ
jgi:hypothetical protein